MVLGVDSDLSNLLILIQYVLLCIDMILIRVDPYYDGYSKMYRNTVHDRRSLIGSWLYGP